MTTLTIAASDWGQLGLTPSEGEIFFTPTSALLNTDTGIVETARAWSVLIPETGIATTELPDAVVGRGVRLRFSQYGLPTVTVAGYPDGEISLVELLIGFVVDPTTLEPTEDAQAAWDLVLAQVAAAQGAVVAQVAIAQDAALDADAAKDIALAESAQAGTSAYNAGQSAATALGHKNAAAASAGTANTKAGEAAASAASVKRGEAGGTAPLDNSGDATNAGGKKLLTEEKASTSYGTKADVAAKAPLASPAFTGMPTVNGQQIAPAATPYPYWRKRLAQVRAGLSDAKILCLGDSTTYGYVAPPNNVGTPAIASYPSDLAAMLNAYFAPAFVGLATPKLQSGVSVDGRWALGTGWAAAPGDAIGWAGTEVYKAAASSGALVYTPGASAGPCDTFDVYYVANGGTPPFTIQATGGAVVTVTPGTQNGIFRATCVAAAASTTNAVSIITSAVAGSRRVVGVEAYHSSQRRIRVGNAGVGGAASVGWAFAMNSYQSFACIAAYAPDLTIISLGLNDMPSPNTPPATFAANLTAIVNACRLSGDVVLMVPPPPAIGGSSNLTDGYKALVPVYSALAASLNIGLVDINGRWVSYDILNPLGYYSDTLHPSRVGYGDMAQAVMSLVRTI
jgi:lysophospholipase L1-like esterase